MNKITPEQREFLHILKTSSSYEAKAFMKDRQMHKPIVESFGQFMTRMIRKSKLTRVQISMRANISTDYMYKILNGAKRTEERDYVIAICMATKMGYSDIQHALELYPFPVLDDADGRSEIIAACILNHIGIDEMNCLLEKAGYPPLRTSPEMEHAEVGPVSVFHFGENVEIGSDRSNPEDKKQLYSGHRPFMGGLRMRELNCRTSKERCGNGPFDVAYIGEAKVENDEGKIRYVCIHLDPSFTVFCVGTKSWYDDDADEIDYDEYYDDDIAADYYAEKNPDDEELDDFEVYETIMEMITDSKYFEIFAKLDRLTDEMLSGRKIDIPDTKIDGCQAWPTAKLLCGSSVIGGKPRAVMELFNTLQPDYNEYLQIMKDGDEYFYSSSIMSCFTAMHLGKDLFHVEFGDDAPDPEFVFQVKSIEEVPEELSYFKKTFEEAKVFLDDCVIGRGCTILGVDE